jgi:hypothetical protein
VSVRGAGVGTVGHPADARSARTAARERVTGR